MSDDMLRQAELLCAKEPTPENQQRLQEIRARIGWRSPHQIKRDELTRLMSESPHPTKEICVLLGEIGGSLWSGNYLDDTVQEWRVNGKCKTWVNDPTAFKLPVKQGWNSFSYITHDSARHFDTQPPPRPVFVTVRRVELVGDYVKENVLGIQAGTYFGKGEKLWAYQASDLTQGGPGSIQLYTSNEAVSRSTQVRTLRADNRDTVRALIRDHYRLRGLSVRFTK